MARCLFQNVPITPRPPELLSNVSRAQAGVAGWCDVSNHVTPLGCVRLLKQLIWTPFSCEYFQVIPVYSTEDIETTWLWIRNVLEYISISLLILVSELP